MIGSLSVVIPLYRSCEHLEPLLDRLRRALGTVGAPWELVLIDDHCPDASGSAAAALVAPDEDIRIARLDHNVGQLAAVCIGLAEATGEFVAVMDADLQDRPEDLPDLIRSLAGSDADVVAAGRSGSYTTGGRRITARLFRLVRSALTRGRIPRDAGLFLVARRETVRRVLGLDDPMLHPVSGFARVKARVISVPVERSGREHGSSGYSRRRRLTVAAAALAALTPLFPLVRSFHRLRSSPVGQVWLAGSGRISGAAAR